MPSVTSIKNKPVDEDKRKHIFYNFRIKEKIKNTDLSLKDIANKTRKIVSSFVKKIAAVFEKDEIKIDESKKVVYKKKAVDDSKSNELLKPNESLLETLGLFLRSSLNFVKKFVTLIVNKVADVFMKDDAKIDESYKVVYRKNVTDTIKSNELPIPNPSVSSPPTEEDLFLSGFQFKFNEPLKDSENIYDEISATDHIYEEIPDLSKIVSMRYKQTAEKSHDESGHYDRLDHALSDAENQDKKKTRLNRYTQNEEKKCDGSGHYAHLGCAFFKPSVDVPPPLPPKSKLHILGKL